MCSNSYRQLQVKSGTNCHLLNLFWPSEALFLHLHFFWPKILTSILSARNLRVTSLLRRLRCWCAMSNIELCTTFLCTHSFNSSKYKLLRREKSKQGSCANFAYNTRYPRSSPFNSTSRVRGYFHTSTDLSVVHKRLRRIFPYTSIIRKNLKCTGNTTGKKKTSNAFKTMEKYWGGKISE